MIPQNNEILYFFSPELLNYPDGSQNKAVVLQAAVDNIKNLKVIIFSSCLRYQSNSGRNNVSLNWISPFDAVITPSISFS